jgi:molybdenum cofactor cytidylyltransferase
MAHRRQIDLRERSFASRLKVTPDESPSALLAPIAGIILSGGASRRMGTPKALLLFKNETFLDRLIRVLSSVCDPIVVVVGRHADQIRSGVERGREVLFAENPDPDRGMLSSLQCGLALVPDAARAAMFVPVDHPNIEVSTVETLAARFHSDRPPVTVPTYAGEHGHPVCIARQLVDELLALPPGAKASDVIHRHVSRTIYLEVADSAVITDVDDPSAYAELLARNS